MSTQIGLGDIVSFEWSTGNYDTATVTEVHADGTVDLFRPYVHTANFSCGGREKGSSRVIAYIGFEQLRNVNPAKLKVIRENPEPPR